MAHTPIANLSPPENDSLIPGIIHLPAWEMYASVQFPTPVMNMANREAWLNTLSIPFAQVIKHAAKELKIELDTMPDMDKGKEDPTVVRTDFDISVAPLTHKKCIGLCRHANSHGGKARIQLDTGIDCPVMMAHVLLHEMVHAYTFGDGHKGRFKKIMKHLDSSGRMTATMPGEVQTVWITALLEYFPEWSDVHTPFKITPRGKRGKGSRMIKIVCKSQYCGCVFRLSQKWIDEAEWLACPVCHGEAAVIY